jgi:hypothetical protein
MKLVILPGFVFRQKPNLPPQYDINSGPLRCDNTPTALTNASI